MRTFIMTAVFSLVSIFAVAQAKPNAKQDASGNYTAIATTRSAATTELKSTGKTYTDAKGKKSEVFVSANGKLFINVTSKSGNVYKKYLNL
jgi:hypothetical protein